MTEIKIPSLGESVSEATIARWLKNEGDAVNMNDPIVELETDKVTLEINAPASGTIEKVLVAEGDTVNVGAIIAHLKEGEGTPAATTQEAAPAAEEAPKAEAPQPTPAAAPAPQTAAPAGDRPLSPSVQKMVSENGINPSDVPATGPGGRITKGDVLDHMAAPSKPAPAIVAAESERRVKMSRLRQRVAERLKDAQNTAAILTTFNEVDMTNIMALRNTYKEAFQKRYDIKLGFMSFFVKAAIQALQEFPAVNASIEGDEIVYKNFYNVGVAVGTEQGLVVPVLRNAEHMSIVDIERTIADFGARARAGKIGLDDLSGGSFTISNGGVYGSLMSTPILNPPQSGILGMHKTQKRPMVVGDKIEIRPMMYLALSYDHRIIDGKEAVSFLVRVKECIEDPSRLLLAI